MIILRPNNYREALMAGDEGKIVKHGSGRGIEK